MTTMIGYKGFEQVKNKSAGVKPKETRVNADVILAAGKVWPSALKTSVECKEHRVYSLSFFTIRCIDAESEPRRWLPIAKLIGAKLNPDHGN